MLRPSNIWRLSKREEDPAAREPQKEQPGRGWGPSRGFTEGLPLRIRYHSLKKKTFS